MKIAAIENLMNRDTRIPTSKTGISLKSILAKKKSTRAQALKGGYQMPKLQIWAGPNFFFYMPVEE